MSVSQAVVDSVHRRVQAAIPDIVAALSPAQRAVLARAQVGVTAQPTPRDLRIAAVPAGHTLAGLYEHAADGHDRIQVFAVPTVQFGLSEREILQHEVAHMFRCVSSDHVLQPCVIGLAANDPTLLCSGEECATHGPIAAAMTVRSATAPPRVAGSRDNCPVCIVHQRLSAADGVLHGLMVSSGLRGRIPKGEGGVIAQARVDLAEAQGQLAQVRTMMPATVAQIDELDATLRRAQEQLMGWITNPEVVARAYDTVHLARAQAYAIAAVWYAPRD